MLEAGNTKLWGRLTGREFGFGDVMKAKLLEASPINGGLIFKYIDPEEGDGYYAKGGRGRARVAEKKKNDGGGRRCRRRSRH